MNTLGSGSIFDTINNNINFESCTITFNFLNKAKTGPFSTNRIFTNKSKLFLQTNIFELLEEVDIDTGDDTGNDTGNDTDDITENDFDDITENDFDDIEYLHGFSLDRDLTDDDAYDILLGKLEREIRTKNISKTLRLLSDINNFINLLRYIDPSDTSHKIKWLSMYKNHLISKIG